MTSTIMPRRARPPTSEPVVVRVAIYARKSTDKVTDADFTTIDNQLQSCRSYIASQRNQGWVEVGEPYADPGYSAATLNRPAIQRLLADVQSKAVDVIVAYRMDRLSRRQLDMLTVLDLFDRCGVRFVSVTEAIGTSTPIGRAMISLLGVFAQMERETIVERIRHKMSEARRRGKWQGGRPVLGYDVVDKRLEVNEGEAELVREVFEAYTRLGSLTATIKELKARAISNKRWQCKKGQQSGGRDFNTATLRRLLSNRLYRGELPVQGDEWADGEHQAIVPQALWDRVQALLASNADGLDRAPRCASGAVLQSILRCGVCGSVMTPTHARKGPRKYVYYTCLRLKKEGNEACPGSRVAAHVVEEKVVAYVREVARQPAVLAATMEAAHAELARERERLAAELRRHEADVRRLHAERARLVEAVSRGDSKAVVARLGEVEQRVGEAAHRINKVQAEIDGLATEQLDATALREVLAAFEPVWLELGPTERARVLAVLLERVSYDGKSGGVAVEFRADGTRTLLAEAS